MRYCRLSRICDLTKFAIAIVTKKIIMGTMNISLPDPMRSWVEEQAKAGRYANSSDYVRDQTLTASLLEG